MRIRWYPAIALVFALLAVPALAQNQPADTVRTLLAAGRLASVVGMPIYFRLYRAHLPAAQHSSYTVSNTMVYGMSGDLTIDIGGKAQSLAAGVGALIPAGELTTISAPGPEPANFLLFVLSSRPNQGRPLLERPGVVQEMFRTEGPLTGLQSGPYEYSLTRVTMPAGMPVNPAHYRSGAALYYVLAGTGAFAADGTTQPKPAGTPHFEPFGWVHQWANPGNAPLVLLQANISQEGIPAVLQGVPPATH